jgi:hypothetical protein
MMWSKYADLSRKPKLLVQANRELKFLSADLG